MSDHEWLARRELLVTALRSLRDVGETLQRGDSGGRFVPGPRVLTMPRAWHAGCPKDCIANGTCKSTFSELVRCLNVLRKHVPRHHWNVNARYVVCERLGRDLVIRGGSYFDFTRKGERVAIGDPIGPTEAVLYARADPRGIIPTRPGQPRAQIVRAIVERWEAGVVPRIVEGGLEMLSGLLPREIPLPAEIAATVPHHPRPKRQVRPAA